eukprot:37099-Amphidinium_carterae.1
MSLRVIKSSEHHTMTIRERIQEAHRKEQPPGLAHSPPGGHQLYYENEGDSKQDVMPQRKNRTVWAIVFDMVAELA